MRTKTTAGKLKQDLRRLMRSMDFVSKHPALDKGGSEAERMAEVYQHLGLSWEFLALQCRHRAGWRTTREGRIVCRVCGTVKGASEPWLLLPNARTKRIGRRTLPTTKLVLANRKKATLTNDTVEFHGARLNVEVLNPHRSRLFRGRDISIAADRIVSLDEGGVECRIDTHLVTLRMTKRRRGDEPPFSAFVWELPRKALKRFPVMLKYDKLGRFVGLTIFRPLARRRQTAAQGRRAPRSLPACRQEREIE